MSLSLQRMRGLLVSDASLDGKTAGLAELDADVFRHVLAHSPGSNGQVALTSQAMRRKIAGTTPLPPLWFHVNVRQFPGATPVARVGSMLTALEAQAQQFSLQSIEMPGFELDVEPSLVGQIWIDGVHGSYGLGRVLDQRCALLESLDLSHTEINVWAPIGAGLAACVALESVNLAGGQFTDRNNPFRGLAQCAALRELDLQEAHLGFECRELAPVLVACRALTKLGLSRTGLGLQDTRVVPPVYCLQYVTDALLNHPSLEHLDVSDCDLNVDCMNLLLGVLPTCARLEHLVMAKNRLYPAKLAILGATVLQCPGLRTLDLRRNTGLGWTGLHAFATSHALRGLARLNLAHCGLYGGSPTAGAPFMAELPQCVRLAQLDLSYNNLGDNFVRALAGRLPAMAALARLDLAGAGLSDGGVLALAQALPRCAGLVRLNLRDNACRPETAKTMRAAWAATHPDEAGLWMD